MALEIFNAERVKKAAEYGQSSVIVTLELIEHLVSAKKKAAGTVAGKENLRKRPRKNRPSKTL